MVLFRENELTLALTLTLTLTLTHDLPHTNHWATENSSNEQVICGLT